MKTTMKMKREVRKAEIRNKVISLAILLTFNFMNFTSFITNGVANNPAITNTTLTGQDVASDFTLIQFDISWENSWRTSTLESNWDAVWVFVKYELKAPTVTWAHATLNYVDGTATNDGHTQPAGSTITTPSDGKGVLIYRDADGIGNVSFPGVQLRWNYGADGLADDDSVEICVFAIEMVYVPQNPFYLGDGTTSNIQGHFSQADNNTIPYLINNENARTLGGVAAANIGNNSRTGMIDVNPTYEDWWTAGTAKTLPAAFPKGYKAFYCMKYEVTHGQYVDFLNKLTSTQAISRANIINNYRHNIAGAGPPNYTTTLPYRALTCMMWGDLGAYLDWAALRPMTEFEYEKACRGDTSVAQAGTFINQYAWGSTTLTKVTGFSNDGTATEGPTPVDANMHYGTTSGALMGPHRVGMFARAATLDRDTTGATYYGIMEMSGNAWETIISVGRTEGRNFTGTHGDGALDVSGYLNAASWPAGSGAPYGVGLRGGGWYYIASYARVSSRYVASYYPWLQNRATWNGQNGGRGVRTAP